MQLSFSQHFWFYVPQITINPGRHQLLTPLNSTMAQYGNSRAIESRIYESELKRFSFDRI